jgi:hypothetical protein
VEKGVTAVTTTYMFTERDLEDNLTWRAQALLGHLNNEGYLSDGDYEYLMRTRIMVVKKPSQISRIWKKIFRWAEDEPTILVAVIADPGKPEDEEGKGEKEDG